MKKSPKILIVASMDKSANEERVLAIRNFLNKNNIKTVIFDSHQTFNRMLKLQNFFISPKFYLVYLIKNILFRIHLNRYYPFFEEMHIRGSYIASNITNKNFNLIIFENPQDIVGMQKINKGTPTLYDCPTILSEEFKSENICSPNDIKKIFQVEKHVFETCSYVSFHWESFLSLATNLGIKVRNPLILNWGCNPQKSHSIFKKPSSFVYIGKLNANWVNPQFLESVKRKYQNQMDIFSYEHPDSRYCQLKTSGFLKNLDVLANYQFGLITLNDCQLRNSGFSAKHLMYFNYGLPVFCPEIRRDPLLEPATIYYNSNNFDQVIKKYSNKKLWTQKHEAALLLAHKLSWNRNLQPLVKIISNLQ